MQDQASLTYLDRIQPRGTKVALVHRRIKEFALHQGPNVKLPTVDEMCVSLGASRATITTALEQLEVQKVVRRRQGHGIFVSPDIFQKNFALVVSDMTFQAEGASPFWDVLWGHFIKKAQSRSRAQSETLSIHVVQTQGGGVRSLDDHLASLIAAGQIDGVLGVGLDRETSQWIESYSVPLVEFAGLGTWHIVLDMPKLIRLGTDHLISQGCRHLRLWIGGDTPPAGKVPNENLVRPFRESLQSHGLPFDDSRVWSYEDYPRPHQHREQGHLAAERLLRMEPTSLTDGLMIMDDMVTLGALRALYPHLDRLGIKIASHANKGTSVLYPFEDRLTLIEFDPAEIVRSMFDLLDQVLAGRPPAQNFVLLGPVSMRLPS